jgi:UDPglucose--hexose-1-phosphate uridylyltransferase
MPEQVLDDLALALHAVLKMQDHLWPTPQSYILSVHQAPRSLSKDHDYRCSIRLQPMLRGPGLQKYLAGVETGGGQFLNDGSPEEKAAELSAAGRRVFKKT